MAAGRGLPEVPGIGRPPMHTGVLLVVLVSVVAAVMAKRSVAGFELNGAARRFAGGTRLRLQLLGRDAPTYEAPDRPFRIVVSDVRVDLPTRERDPGRALAVRPRG